MSLLNKNAGFTPNSTLDNTYTLGTLCNGGLALPAGSVSTAGILNPGLTGGMLQTIQNMSCGTNGCNTTTSTAGVATTNNSMNITTSNNAYEDYGACVSLIMGTECGQRIIDRLAELNGFGFVYSDLNFGLPNEPGAFGNPIPKNAFLVDMGSGLTHPWTSRINQTACSFVDDTQGLCIFINGVPGRTIYLLRIQRPYYFYFRLPKFNPLYPNDPAQVELDKNGFYFTRDPIGGRANNVVNGGPLPNGLDPLLFSGTPLIRPGTGAQIVVTDDWPDALFYQGYLGPCMGGIVFVLGSGVQRPGTGGGGGVGIAGTTTVPAGTGDTIVCGDNQINSCINPCAGGCAVPY